MRSNSSGSVTASTSSSTEVWNIRPPKRREGEGGVEVEAQHEVVHLPGPPLAGIEDGGVSHQGGEHALRPAGLSVPLELLLPF
uniref:Uncharacterized protein n=1 Tax=Anguilla anguilla TaxID=7936 RepID=A0A0E9SVD1_ANGAN